MTIIKKYSLVLLIVLFSFITVEASATTEEFEIKHADSLEADEAEINIQGNISIKYKDAIIEAPNGKINTDQEGKPNKAIFCNHAKIKLKDRKIEADKITVSIQEETIYAEGKTSSELKDKSNNIITITADYQNFTGMEKMQMQEEI